MATEIKLTKAQLEALYILREHRVRLEKRDGREWDGWMCIQFSGIRSTTLYAIQKKTQYPLPTYIESAYPAMTIEIPYNPDVLVALKFRADGNLWARITDAGMEFIS